MSAKSPHFQEAFIIAAFILAAVLGTYPLVIEMGSAIPRGGDSWQNYWNLWWVKTALIERGVSPYFAPDVYFPYGASLYFHTLNFLPAVIALPVAVIHGIPAAYNFLVLLSFVLSGYGMYRLALYLIIRLGNQEDSRSAMHFSAFIAGSAFAFSSYRYVHLFGHLDLLSTQWLPLFVLFLLKSRDESRWRNPIIAGFMLAAAMLTSAYYMVFLLVFTAVVVANSIWTDRRNALPRVLRIGAAIGLFLALVSPVLVPMLFLGRTEGRTFNPAYDIDRFSTDLLAFVVPSPRHPLWQHFVAPLYSRIMRPGTSAEIIAFVGFVPLALGLVGLKRCPPARKLWLPLALLFVLLALGPVVHFAGRAVMPQISDIMPYRLLSLLPYGDIPRVPARYSVMVILCLSVLAGAGAWTVLRGQTPAGQRKLAVLLTVAAIGENTTTPIPMMTPQEPPVFRQIASDPRRAGVLEVPISSDPAAYPERMMYQTIHKKPIYGGYLSRGLPPIAFSAVPGFAQFAALSDTVDDVVVYDPADLQSIGRAALNFYSAGHVVIEKKLLDTSGVDRARREADVLLGSATHVYEDGAMLAYAVPQFEKNHPAAVWLDSGWSYLERLEIPGTDGRPVRWRWMSDRARLAISSSRSGQVRLKFTAQAFGRVRRVQLTLNETVIATIPITPDRADYETPPFELNPATTLLELESLDGADSPGEDARRLSIALFRLELICTQSDIETSPCHK